VSLDDLWEVITDVTPSMSRLRPLDAFAALENEGTNYVVEAMMNGMNPILLDLVQ